MIALKVKFMVEMGAPELFLCNVRYSINPLALISYACACRSIGYKLVAEKYLNSRGNKPFIIVTLGSGDTFIALPILSHAITSLYPSVNHLPNTHLGVHSYQNPI